MKPAIIKSLLLSAAVLAASAGAAQAHSSLNIGIGFSSPGPVYYQPAPVYYAPPQPVYYAPAPVYYAPAPYYYQPAPVYYAPAPVYYRAGYSPSYTSIYYSNRWGRDRGDWGRGGHWH